MKKLILSLFLLLPTLPAASLTLIPSGGAISGTPGSTIGWGYSLDNDTPAYLVITSVLESGFDPLLGTFQDFVVNVNITIVGPNSIQTQNFDQGLQQGFGQFVINPGALIGAATGSTFLVNYDLLINDPNGPLGSNPGDQYGLEFTFDGTVTVNADSGVPEPSAIILTSLGLLCAAWRVRRTRASS